MHPHGKPLKIDDCARIGINGRVLQSPALKIWKSSPANGEAAQAALHHRTKCNMKIMLYKKAGCPWSAAVIGFLNELSVPFEIRNVTTYPQYATEVEMKSGKCISPTLDFDGELLADASVEDVAKVLEKSGIVI
jgi:glutaredoxin